MSQRQRAASNSEPGPVMPRWLPQIVFAVVIYSLGITFAGAWWAASQSAASTATKEFTSRLEADVRAMQTKFDRLAVLEEKIGQISKTLEKMEGFLSRQPMRGKI